MVKFELRNFMDIKPINENNIWDKDYKIPWDDPEFSKRMLKEHLSQDHDLASRKKDVIKKQVQWISDNFLGSTENYNLLDLACGPGLYAKEFSVLGHRIKGIDFSPASIDYAKTSNDKTKTEFLQADLRDIDFGQEFDLSMMLYGEINVFSPDNSLKILKKAFNSLKESGKIILEVHTFEAVRNMAQGSPSWHKADSGLFSSDPYICLTENYWIEKDQASLQAFYVIDIASGMVTQMKSTTKAWHFKDYERLLTQAGFKNIIYPKDWPANNDMLFLISAEK